MKRLLSFLLLITVTASISSYARNLPAEVKKELAPAVQGDDSYEHTSVRAYSVLFSAANFRRVTNFKYRLLTHFNLFREFALAIPFKQLSPALSSYRSYSKPIGLKLIYPQHYFW